MNGSGACEIAMTERPTAGQTQHGEASDKWRRPTAAFLRPLIVTLLADDTAPAEIHDECRALMRVISANNLAEIVERLAHLRRLATANDYQLPTLDVESEHPAQD